MTTMNAGIVFGLLVVPLPCGRLLWINEEW
jgi:hypothetical protein